MNNKTKTPIIDKNGKATHVWKGSDVDSSKSRAIPTVAKDTRFNPKTGFTAAEYNKLKDILKENLDRPNGRLIISDEEFVSDFLKPDRISEHWMSNGVHEFKLFGDGTQFNNFHIYTRAADKETLEAVDKASAEIAEVFGHKAPAKLAPQELKSKVSEGTIIFTTPDGEEVEFKPEQSFENPVSHIDPMFEQLAGGAIRGIWAVADDEPRDYDWMDGDSFQEFRSEEARDNYIESKVSEGVSRDHIFIVDKYDHSSVHYSVKDTAAYPDRQFDVAPSGVLILDAKGENEALGAVFDNESANATLKDYTEYANGNVYGIASALFDKNGEMTHETEVVWGYIGTDYAQESVNNGGF